MSPLEFVKTVVAELFRQVGHGRLGHLQRTLNVNKNFFSRWKEHPERVRLLTLAQALEYLQIEPGEFFATVLIPKDSKTEVEKATDRSDRSNLPNISKFISAAPYFTAMDTPLPSDEPPAGVRRALDRMAAVISQDEEPRFQTQSTLDRQAITRLDEFRWDNPRKANQLLERGIERCPMELLARLLLVYGTTFRQLDRLTDARWAYCVAEIRAKQTGDRAIFAAILQRKSWVEFAEGRSPASLDLLRRAAGIFAELGDSNREAKVLVSMARQYVDLEKFEEAVTCADSALRKLRETEKHHRFTAHQVLVLAYNGLGDTKAVLRSLEVARSLLRYCPKGAKLRFVWLDAKMRKDILPLETAAHVFEEAASYFGEIGEVQASALAMLEFVKCLVALGKQQELLRVAEILRSFAFEVDDGRESGSISAAALMEVYRSILKAAASETLIFSIVQDIKKAASALEAPAAVDV